jgi:dephospho-CoA kinase
MLAARAQQPVIVVEAIKLLESEIAGWCDSVWVVDVPPQVQVARLMHKRSLTAEQAQLRIAAQPSQNDKIAKADVVIDNSQSFEETWSQMQSHWLRLVPGQVVPDLDDTVAMTPAAPQMTLGAAPTVMVRRGKPADAAAIATFINQSTQNARSLTRADVMAAFGEKAFVLAQVNDSLGALAGWQVENLVTRVDDMYVLDNVPPDLIFKPLLESIETASRELQSEAAFLFVPPALKGGAAAALAQAGHEESCADNLTITAWRDAVRESQPAGALVFFKKLREDRVMRPV